MGNDDVTERSSTGPSSIVQSPSPPPPPSSLDPNSDLHDWQRRAFLSVSEKWEVNEWMNLEVVDVIDGE